MKKYFYDLESYRFCIGAFLTVLFVSMTGSAVFALTAEVSPETVERTAQLLPEWHREFILPENKERQAFLWSVLTLPVWAFAAWLLVRRITEVRPCLYWGLAVFVSLWSIIALTASRVLYEDLFKSLEGPCAAVALLMVILIAWLLYKGERTAACRYWLGIGIFLLILQIYTVRIYFPEYVNYVDRSHFGVVAQAISIASAGLFTPSQYGLYPYFLLPIFTLSGCSAIKLSLVMGVLYLLEMGLMLWILQNLLRHKWLVVVAAASIVMIYSTASLHIGDFDPYFQYHPIRSFWPCFAIFAAYLLVVKSQPVNGGAVCGLLAAVALFWNFDSGIVVALGLLAWLGWNAFCRRRRQWWQGFGAYIGVFMPAVLFLYGVFSLWNGAPLDLGAATEFQRLFYFSGFFLLPIPALVHAWTLIALLYVVALLYGAWRIYNSPADVRGQIYFLTGIIGIGLFPYYQGRSADGNLLCISYLAIFILILLVDQLSVIVRRRRLRTALVLPWLVMVGWLAMLTGTFLCDLPVSIKLIRQVTGRAVERKPEYYADIRFIKEHAPADKIANIIGAGQGFYSIETDISPGFLPFNYIEMASLNDIQYFLENLVISRRPLFVTARKFVYDWEPPAQYFEQFFILQAVSSSGKVRYYLPKPLEE